jgi:hypothetical protein
MIIGEFDNSNFDDYEENSYDYLFKRKSKAEREEKRLTKKENRPLKKFGLLPGRRKLPLAGNFGMFDKNKRKNKNVSPNSIQVGVNSADMNTDATPSAPPESDTTPVSSPAPAEAAGVSAASKAIPNVSVSGPSSSGEAEMKVPANAITSIVSPESEKAKTTEKSDAPVSAEKATKDQTKGDAKKSNVKEAGFSSMLGFAFLGVALILAGYAIFKADQKSRKELNPLKATA